MKLGLFGYEIVIRKEYFSKLHVTEKKGELKKVEEYQYKFDMEKRMRAMVGDKQFIDYVFRDLGLALLTYRDSAVILLEGVMASIRKIRDTLKSKGASDEHLAVFDSKVRKCFGDVMRDIENRLKSDNNITYEEDMRLLRQVEKYDIDNYHGGDVWK